MPHWNRRNIDECVHPAHRMQMPCCSVCVSVFRFESTHSIRGKNVYLILCSRHRTVSIEPSAVSLSLSPARSHNAYMHCANVYVRACMHPSCLSPLHCVRPTNFSSARTYNEITHTSSERKKRCLRCSILYAFRVGLPPSIRPTAATSTATSTTTSSASQHYFFSSIHFFRFIFISFLKKHSKRRTWMWESRVCGVCAELSCEKS